MPQYTFAPVAVASVPMHGEYSRFPVHRIYCVGRNFAEHAKEMGAPVEKGTPVIFMKPGDAIVTDGHVPYPTQTSDLHHEVELVVALGRDARGELSVAEAMSLVHAYGVGLDLTRRDLQAVLKDKRLPWDISKGFDASAPISALVPVSEAGLELGDKRLWLEVNGELRQQAPLSDMIFGVAALRPGDRFRAGIDGLVEFSGEILPA
jgi:fumarylpyruvate hydrolase